MSFILLTILIVIIVGLNEAHYVGPLIKNIHNKYEADAVTIISETNSASFERITIWHNAIRMLSNEGISTRLLKFRQFEDQLKFRSHRPGRSLMVIAIDTMKELKTFESFIKDVHIRYAVWLILFTGDAGLDVCEFCRNPHGSVSNPRFGSTILTLCCNSNIIEEWRYSPGNSTRKLAVGRLMNEDHEVMWYPGKIKSGLGYSLDGRGLRIAATDISSIFTVNNGKYRGFGGELLQELSQAMNFTISKIIWEHSSGGWNEETSKHYGVFGKIIERKADLGVSLILMMKKHLGRVSFTAPLFIGPLQLHYRKHDNSRVLWNAHFKPFAMDVWMAIVGLILITPILLTLVKYKRRYHFFPLHFKHHLYVWGIFCSQGLPEFPSDVHCRIIYISIMLSTLVIAGAYSARIISSLATPSTSTFKTVEQFVQDGTYKLITLKNNIGSELFELSDPKLMKKLMALLKPTELLPLNSYEGFQQVCSERVAFYTHAAARKFLLNRIPCEIESLDSGRVATMAMIMPFNSEYRDVVNHHMQQFRENGIWERLEQKYFTGRHQDVHDPPLVDLEQITPLLLILAVGFLIAFVIFVVERNSKKMTNIFQRQPTSRRWRTLKRRLRFQRISSEPENTREVEGNV